MKFLKLFIRVGILCLLGASTVFAGISADLVCRTIGQTSVINSEEECDSISRNSYFSQNGLDLCLNIAEQGAGAIANRCMRAIKGREISSREHSRCSDKSSLSSIVNCLEENQGN